MIDTAQTLREQILTAVQERRRDDKPALENLLPELGRPDVPFDGKISLLINVHNEGADLAQTCISFARTCLAPLEIGIFADMTTDDSLAQLAEVAALDSVEDIFIIRHTGPKPFGCGRAKAKLVERCTGDFIMHSDGHNRAIRGTLDQAARFGCYLPCVVQPALGPLHCKPHEQATEKVPHNCYYGGRVIVKKGLPDIDQRTSPPRRPAARTECVNNSAFGYPRMLLNQFGGWHKFPGRWGLQEAGFSWRCWFTKTPIFTLRDFVVLHRYQDWWDGPNAGEYKGARKSYSVPGWHRRANRRYAIRVMFNASTWEKYWKQHLEIVDHDSDGKANAALAESEVKTQHSEFAKLKRRTDDEFFSEIAEMPFNPADAKVNDDATRGLYIISGGLGNALLCVPAIKALAQLTGAPVDLLDKGIHVKSAIDWFEQQPWVRLVLKDQPDYREYRHIIGSYWQGPPITILEGCTIAPAQRQHRTKHEAWSNMEAVRNAGFTGPTPSPRMIIDPISHDVLGNDPIAVCTEAAGRREDVDKCFPRWEETCRILKSAGARLVFLGNNTETPPWMDELGENLTGKTKLMDAVHIIASARLYLGIDNGLAHVAAAVGTPQLLVYGTTSPRKNLQLAQGLHVIQSDYQCGPCFDTPRKKHCKEETPGAKPCMRAIDPARIAHKALHLIEQPYADAMPPQQLFLARKQMIENAGLELFQEWHELTGAIELVRRLDPVRVLTLKAHHGAWSLAISAACSPGTEFYMVDSIDQPQRQEAETKLREFGMVPKFIKGDSTKRNTLDLVHRALGDNKVDLLYIDGHADYAHAATEFSRFSTAVRKGGAIMLHDITNQVNDATGTRRLWDELTAAPETWETMTLQHGHCHGYGIVFIEPARK